MQRTVETTAVGVRARGQQRRDRLGVAVHARIVEGGGAVGAPRVRVGTCVYMLYMYVVYLFIE